ncbi:MAG: DUF2798 domain-containing protein [Pseudodesulfovibrio sp.]
MSFEQRAKLVNAVLMSGFMALIMSGCLSLINFGPTPEWLRSWGRSFLLAWPLALVLSLSFGSLLMRLSHRLVRRDEGRERA